MLTFYQGIGSSSNEGKQKQKIDDCTSLQVKKEVKKAAKELEKKKDDFEDPPRSGTILARWNAHWGLLTGLLNLHRGNRFC